MDKETVKIGKHRDKMENESNNARMHIIIKSVF